MRCVGDLLVGFKHIAHVIDREGPDLFVYGTEESHGYLVGQYCRDKDGAVACMLMSELAAELKSQGISMHEYLFKLYRKHGYHRETLINLFMEGSEGMAVMKRLMQSFRTTPPESLAGIKIAKVRDYSVGKTSVVSTGKSEPLPGPVGDLIILDLAEEGNYVGGETEWNRTEDQTVRVHAVVQGELAGFEQGDPGIGSQVGIARSRCPGIRQSKRLVFLQGVVAFARIPLRLPWR